MDIERLYQDYSIRRAYDGEKHYKKGWVNMPCPFCTGNVGNHLGFNTTENYYKCWRCGFKSVNKVLIKILGISYNETKRVIRQYQGKSYIKPQEIRVVKVNFKMPYDSKTIIQNSQAMRYLQEERGFKGLDAHWIAKRFKLQATDDMGFFEYGEKEMDLSHRIIAPIFHEGKMVSWQSRDITDSAFLKYITCPEMVEIMEHKKVLYNAPDPIKYPIVVLCEGIVDVWKVVLAGFPATCCFGVDYTADQLKLLLRYAKVISFLDPDKAGVNSARKLMKQILFAGKDIDTITNTWNKDPGDMTKRLIRKILKPLMILGT